MQSTLINVITLCSPHPEIGKGMSMVSLVQLRKVRPGMTLATLRQEKGMNVHTYKEGKGVTIPIHNCDKGMNVPILERQGHEYPYR